VCWYSVMGDVCAVFLAGNVLMCFFCCFFFFFFDALGTRGLERSKKTPSHSVLCVIVFVCHVAG
jgi:hypothetical protein